jgi:bile acid-coenzyme A ligase
MALYPATAPATETHSSFTQRLSELAATDPEAAAVTLGETTLSRAELEDAADRLARSYLAQGVGVGDYVAIVLRNGPDFVVATVAAWKIGAIPQPLSNKLAPAELAELLALSDPALLVGAVDPAIAGGRPQLDNVLPVEGARNPTAAPLPPVISPAWKAMCSGGSTGRPKCIVSTDPALAATLLRLPSARGLSPGDATLVTAPLSHNGPFVAMASTLLTGGHVVLMGRFDPLTTLQLVERHRVTRLYLVPTMMSRIWRLPAEQRDAVDLCSLRTVTHMGAPCPQWLKRAWIDWLGPERLVELYTTTEGVVIFSNTGTEWLRRPGTAGRPLGGGLVQIRDADGAVLPAGTPGRIWVHRPPGSGPSYRYLGGTAQADTEGWETVGDIGRLDDDGYLYVEDREADMILVGGSNVYPAEVEAALSTVDGVEDSCVVGLPDEDLGQIPHAIVYATGAVTEASLLAQLRERLAPYKLPGRVEFVSSPLRDEAGKVRRAQLRNARLTPPAEPTQTTPTRTTPTQTTPAARTSP